MPRSTKRSPAPFSASSAAQSPTLVSSFALWLLVFSCGWFVMLTELVGARVLAPYFGNSIYVWGSVIAIFLLAMAVGYALGGSLTQRLRSYLVPVLVAVLAGIYVAATPLYQDALSNWLYNTGVHVKWGSLIATVILYGLPMIMLGMVSPYAIQIATRTHSEAGSRAGILYALSTVGSFLGCLVTAFVLIPGMPMSYVIVGGGIILSLIAVIVAMLLAGRNAFALGAAVLVVVVAAVAVAKSPVRREHKELKAYQYSLTEDFAGTVDPSEVKARLEADWSLAREELAKYPSDRETVLVRTETPYYHLTVHQKGPMREMIFGESDYFTGQTIVDMRDIHRFVAEYTHLAFAGLLYRPAPRRVCVIGVGGAVIPRALERHFPGVRVDAIDIDAEVITAARQYFFWKPSSNVRMYAMDGRSFLNWVVANHKPLYDWVIVDAFNDNSIPFHLTTAEFFSVVMAALVPDGVLSMNMFIDNELYGFEARTIESVFGNMSAFAGHRSGNILMTAQKGREASLTLDEAGAAARKVTLPADSSIDPLYIMSCLVTKQNWSDEGPILTDLWSPVENLVK